jgi:hypothetical protein
LTHLTTLTTKTTHALFAPLGTHTTVDIQAQGKGILVFNAVGSKGTSFNVSSSRNKADEVGWNEFLILNHELEGFDISGRVHLVRGGRATGSGDKDLHSCVVFVVKIRLLKTCHKEKKRRREIGISVLLQGESTGLEMTHDLFSVHPGKVYETNRDDASSCNALLLNESIEALYYMPWSSEIELTKRG